MPAEPWSKHARQWDLLGPPLRPAAADVAVVEDIAREPRSTPLRVLLLGVTPELATLPWPAGTSFVAVDRSEAMIAAVWPRSGTPAGATVVLHDWRSLPQRDASMDLVLGDGVATVFDYPEGARAMLAEVSRVLAPGGRLVARAFVPPRDHDPPSAIESDLWAGRVGSVSALKLRLWTALQASAERGVRLADVWEAWHAMCPDPAALVSKLGWLAEAVATLETYRDSDVRYTFPSLGEIVTLARSTSLGEMVIHTKRYELGERCPTFVLERRA